MNPFEIHGPAFLFLYLGISVALGAVSLFVKQVIKNSTNADIKKCQSLHPYEMAYLSGGDEHAILAAMSYLLQRNIARVEDSKESSNVVVMDANSLEKKEATDQEKGLLYAVGDKTLTNARDLENKIAVSTHGRTWANVLTRKEVYRECFDKIRAKLESEKLILASSQERLAHTHTS